MVRGIIVLETCLRPSENDALLRWRRWLLRERGMLLFWVVVKRDSVAYCVFFCAIAYHLSVSLCPVAKGIPYPPSRGKRQALAAGAIYTRCYIMIYSLLRRGYLSIH